MKNNKGKQNFKIVSGRRFDDFLAQTRLNLDPDEHVIFIYDGAPAHRNPGPNSELRKLPPYSPFLNIAEQAVSTLKAAIKADISRPEIQVQMKDRAEADVKDLPWEITPFAVHYERIRIHLRENAKHSAKIHSLARKTEHLRVNQIQ